MRDLPTEVPNAIYRIAGKLNASSMKLPFNQLNIDSFDLMTLRVDLEQIAGDISDSDWTGFESFADIVKHFRDQSEATNTAPGGSRDAYDRRVKINMPQMAAGGLSESWIFKEAGDLHWTKLSAALERPSHAITDELGNRLYATFLRFRMISNAPLKAYVENDELGIKNSLSRLGKGMFFSSCRFEGQGNALEAELMSSFTSRAASNTGLMKGDPVLPSNMTVPELGEMPQLGQQYREMRKGLAANHELAGVVIPVSQNVLFECEYEINPYTDVNGVNLVYFAAYPIIADTCERRYANRDRTEGPGRPDHAQNVSVSARDVFYFGNLDLNDSLIYKLYTFQWRGDVLYSQAALHRKSDGELISMIFVVKRREDAGNGDPEAASALQEQTDSQRLGLGV